MHLVGSYTYNVFFCTDCLPEDGRKMADTCSRFTIRCMQLYLNTSAIVLTHMVTHISARKMDNFK